MNTTKLASLFANMASLDNQRAEIQAQISAAFEAEQPPAASVPVAEPTVQVESKPTAWVLKPGQEAAIVKDAEGRSLLSVVLTATGSTWFFICDRVHGDSSKGTYPGGALSFQCYDRSGVVRDAVVLNGGLINDDPANLQGCLDFSMYIDGKHFAPLSVQGREHPTDAPGLKLSENLNGITELGQSNARLGKVWVKQIKTRTAATKTRKPPPKAKNGRTSR